MTKSPARRFGPDERLQCAICEKSRMILEPGHIATCDAKRMTRQGRQRCGAKHYVVTGEDGSTALVYVAADVFALMDSADPAERVGILGDAGILAAAFRVLEVTDDRSDRARAA